MIPHSQLLYDDVISILHSTSPKEAEEIMVQNHWIDESNISHLIKQYRKHWKQSLLSENIVMDDSLIFQCFYHFKRQFMQIKCLLNIPRRYELYER